MAAGPLLGLIGTVVGMIVTFQSITESGSSDPKLMAAGISQAMIATVLGLGIAIPLLFANAWLSSISKSIVQILDEQSTGLLAERLEGEGACLRCSLAPFAPSHDMRELGGPIVDWIFLACVMMWAIVIERYWYFRKVLPRETPRMLDEWSARTDRQSWKARQIRQAMISRLNAGMSRTCRCCRVLVPMCPLLGLLGTVGGMLEVFDSMAARGSADARSMANGISEAMICTLDRPRGEHHGSVSGVLLPAARAARDRTARRQVRLLRVRTMRLRTHAVQDTAATTPASTWRRCWTS